MVGQPTETVITGYDELLRRLGLAGDDPGEAFRQLRTRLVLTVERWGSRAPEDLADETLRRVARRLGEGTEIRDLPVYLLGVARKVFHEMLRRGKTGLLFVGTVNPMDTFEPEPVDELGEEVDRLTRCLARLSAADRDMLLAYYDEVGGRKIEHRRKLAKTLGMSRNALTIRAFRLRKWVEKCVCAAKDAVG